MITVQQADCHDTCLDVVGSDGHTANVNPVDGTSDWRVDCNDCGTCVRAGLKTKAEARDLAVEHVNVFDLSNPINEFYHPENCNHRNDLSGAPCVREPGHDPGHYYDYPGC